MDKLPPGPSSALWTTLRFLRKPYEVTADLHARYGDPFFVPTLQGPMVVTGEPEGARAVFSADPDTFSSSATGVAEPLVGETSVLVTSGAAHRASRKLLQPPFNGARMRHYGALMAAVARRRSAAVAADRPFQMHDLLRDISLDVIVEAVLGVSGEARVAETHRAMVELLGALNPIVVTFKWMQRELGGVGPWARFLACRRRVEAIITDEIAARRSAPAERHDILSQLLDARREDGTPLPDSSIFDHMLTLLVAGHETTATAMAWAVYLLHLHPELLERLRRELAALPAPDGDGAAAAEALAGCRYLEAVCQETLRFRPLVGVLSRRLARPFQLGAYQLPAGMSVGVGTSIIHMRPELYPEPERFRPERFLERNYSPYEYFPFGGGGRRCLGAAFALYEMKIVLGTILRAHTFRLVDKVIRPAIRPGVIGLSTRLRMIKEQPAA